MNKLRVQRDLAEKHEDYVEEQVVSLKADLLTMKENFNLAPQAL